MRVILKHGIDGSFSNSKPSSTCLNIQEFFNKTTLESLKNYLLNRFDNIIEVKMIEVKYFNQVNSIG